MQEIRITIRYLTTNLILDVENKINIATGSGAVRRAGLVLPVIRGATLAISISLIEKLLNMLIAKYPDSGAHENTSVPTIGGLRNKQRHLDLDPNWYGWRELATFWVLRHYFAHGMETINDLNNNPKDHIIDFHRDMNLGRYTGRVGTEMIVIDRYFDIDHDQIVLEPSASGRLRLVCFHLLEEIENKGLSLD